jgi:hypothetical protein
MIAVRIAARLASLGTRSPPPMLAAPARAASPTPWAAARRTSNGTI